MLPRRIITDDGQRQIGEVFRDEVRALQSRDVRGCVEIKFQAPHAIDAMLFPQLCLLGGVELARHRRDAHCLISTQVPRPPTFTLRLFTT